MTAELTTEIVAASLAASGVSVTPGEAERLAAFLNLLERWNRTHNLTGLRDRSDLIERHLVESLALGEFVRGPAAADLGSGGGLPGVPLAICLPEVAFTLIESRRKRASFLRHVAATLGLGNVTVAHARAETVTSGPFQTVLARAFAPPDQLLAIARPLLLDAGRLVVLTSEQRARVLARAAGFRALTPVPSAGPIQSRIVVLEPELVS